MLIDAPRIRLPARLPCSSRFVSSAASLCNALSRTTRAHSRAVDTLWTENRAGIVATRGRRVYAAMRSGPKTEIPASIPPVSEETGRLVVVREKSFHDQSPTGCRE